MHSQKKGKKTMCKEEASCLRCRGIHNIGIALRGPFLKMNQVAVVLYDCGMPNAIVMYGNLNLQFGIGI